MYAILDRQDRVIGTAKAIAGEPKPNVRPLEWPKPTVDPESQLLNWNPKYAWEVYPDRVVATYTVIDLDLGNEKQTLTKRLKGLRNTAMDGGVQVTVTNGTHWFDSDAVAKDNVSQAVQDADKRPEQWPKGWRTKHNQWVVLTAADIETVRAAMADHVEACFTRHGELEAEIAAAADFTEFNAVGTETWPTGALA